MNKFKSLIINPGSTSTKIAIFEDENEIYSKTIRHDTDELIEYTSVFSQYQFRKKTIIDALIEEKFDMNSLDVIIGRGGMLRPLEGGVYTVNAKMLKDLESGEYGEHASSLGAKLALEIGDPLRIPSYIVDPVVVDELEEIARISGIPEIKRKSIFHALNQKAVARKAAKELGSTYENLNFVVAHLGGGISVGAHEKGRVIDVNNAVDGEGSFSPERSGGVPVGSVVKLCYAGKYTYNEMKKKITGKGGLLAYLGTSDGREVEKRIESGDENAGLIYEAMAYQTAKEIGAYATVLKGKVDAIILTGGLLYDKNIKKWIVERIDFIAPIIVYPGEDEMAALAEGGLRILRGEEKPILY
ncbi:MAG: butyrate kinase [Firmicutes bacterium HGW-Firmicutes-1]|jgi:butyrate kinase|nr:MAG: butyrate kinase [Firmicutes bacterium HGW-Firmicutes-1]